MGGRESVITESVKKEAFNEEYKNYPAVQGSLEEKPFYEHRYSPIYYEIKQGSKVLDAGCNDGIFMEMLRDKRKCHVTGIDISEVAIAEAKKKNLDVQIADIENMPFPDNYFDYVICMEVLSHLYDPSKALNEIRRVLKKNGVLLGSCPHKNVETYAWDDKRMHRRYFDETELRDLLEESFDRTWMKVLNGAQFSMSLANSFLADQPCEMIFKSGYDILGWDEALQDRSVLRCWFGFSQNAGTVYHRMSAFADKMQEMGSEVHYNPFDHNDPNSTMEWMQKIRYLPNEINSRTGKPGRFTNPHIVDELEALLKASDMSVFQISWSRDILLLLTTAKLGVIKKPMWLEMDDWIFDLPPYNLGAEFFKPNSDAESVAYDHIKLSDGVICSTEFIKEKVQSLFPEKPVYVIKNAIDFGAWDNVEIKTPIHDEKKDLIRITYSGSGTHAGDLEMIVNPIKALLDKFPNLEFVSLPYSSTDSITNPRYIRILQWVSMKAYPQSYANWETDIAIAPLRDNYFNRAKSNLRWLESSALKKPMIASRIYPFEKSITDGKDGVLVSNNEKAWYDALKDLILNEEKRKRIGQAAYKTVKKNYDMTNVAKTYLSVLKTIKGNFLRKEFPSEPKRNLG